MCPRRAPRRRPINPCLRIKLRRLPHPLAIKPHPRIKLRRLPRPQAIALGLSIALVKACLVGAIFMLLWGEAKLIHKFLYVAAFFAAILTLPMIDFVLTAPRIMNHADVAAQHPDEGKGK